MPIIYEELEQGTLEWLEVRKGRLTASEVAAWIAAEPKVRLNKIDTIAVLDEHGIDFNSKAKLGELHDLIPNKEAYETLTETEKEAEKRMINLKLAEHSGCEMEPVFENWAMRRGTELEPHAREAFIKQTGLEVEEVGFVLDPCKRFGMSPDGLLGNRETGVEIKCPLPQTHIKYLLGPKELPEAHKWQVQMQMAVLGSKSWHFFTYCPPLPNFHVIVEADETTELVKKGLKRYALNFNRALKRIAKLCEL